MSLEPGRGPWPGEGDGDGVIKGGDAGRAGVLAGLLYGLPALESDGDPVLSCLPEAAEAGPRLKASTSPAESVRTTSIALTRRGRARRS